jgi:hypothetical protein
MNRVIQGNLLKLAAAFIFLQTLTITLAPAVRLRTWDVDFRWSQWVAFLLWGIFVLRAHRSILIVYRRLIPIYFLPPRS